MGVLKVRHSVPCALVGPLPPRPHVHPAPIKELGGHGMSGTMARAMLCQMAAGLQYLHSQGVLHRYASCTPQWRCGGQGREPAAFTWCSSYASYTLR